MTSAFNCSSTSTEFCYNTAIDAKQIVFGLAINLIIGLACYAGFVLWRGSFRIYSNRLTTPQLAPWQRPPALKLGGHWQLWSWLIPVFTVSDRALLESAGLDALVALRVLGFGCLAFMPLTLLGVGVLIPVTYTGYVVPANHVESNSTTEVFNDAFLRMTMSSLPFGSQLLWSAPPAATVLSLLWIHCSLIIAHTHHAALHLSPTPLPAGFTSPLSTSSWAGCAGCSSCTTRSLCRCARRTTTA